MISVSSTLIRHVLLFLKIEEMEKGQFTEYIDIMK